MVRLISLTPAKAALPRSQRAGIGLKVHCNSLWSLAPKTPKSAFFEAPRLSTVDLTGAIGSHRLCSVAARDYAAKSTDNIDFTVVDHGGLHLLFEAEGTANPLDSPSVLYVTDVDSDCEVCVDGMALKKGTKTKLHPGAIIDFGEGAAYVVHRNVHAHA